MYSLSFLLNQYFSLAENLKVEITNRTKGGTEEKGC